MSPIARSEIQNLTDKIMVLSNQIERATVKIERVEEMMEVHGQKIEKMQSKFIQQDATINLISKVTKIRPLGFIAGILFTLVIASAGFFDVFDHVGKLMHK